MPVKKTTNSDGGLQLLLTLLLMTVLSLTVFGQTRSTSNETMMKQTRFSCKLTTPELQQRKKIVVTELKNLLLEKTETGFKYKFEGSDQMLDLLTDFIKTERLCCDFFTFNLTVSDNNSFVWLELTGPKGVKAFIKDDIEF